MTRQRYEPGELVRGDHCIVEVHHGRLGLVLICRQQLPDGSYVYKAIKTFRLGPGPVSRQLFDRELVYWTQLPPHPNVVQARDADTVEKFLILEYVPGPTLRIVADRRPIHPDHFLRWARQIAAGLRFLHIEHSFLHRDLRPANVLIDTQHDLTAKISDLGIGKPFDPGAITNTIIGTFNYMAPEVYAGRTDFRSDIFSFGATLYFLLTGQYAVSRSTRDMGRVVSPAQFTPGVPDEICEIVQRCLDRDPDRRFPSMDDVIEALDAAPKWRTIFLYAYCRRHRFSYIVESRRERCPFCIWDMQFRRAKRNLEEVLEARRREESSETAPPDQG